MRLGQLARKLALRPADIVDFLAENNIRIEDGTNVRLEKDQINLVMSRFVPGWVEAQEASIDVKTEDDIISAETVAEPEGSNDHAIMAPEPDLSQTDSPDTGEVIRAPKIELSGLRVVGKIDLPEPKKKEVLPKEDSTTAEEGQKERTNKRAIDVNRRRPQSPAKNPVALQREREAKEAQKKRVEQQAREKEKRTQNYLKNYKPASPTRAAKLIKEEVVEMTPQELEEPPKTIFGKILRWLTKAT